MEGKNDGKQNEEGITKEDQVEELKVKNSHDVFLTKTNRI